MEWDRHKERADANYSEPAGIVLVFENYNSFIFLKTNKNHIILWFSIPFYETRFSKTVWTKLSSRPQWIVSEYTAQSLGPTRVPRSDLVISKKKSHNFILKISVGESPSDRGSQGSNASLRTHKNSLYWVIPRSQCHIDTTILLDSLHSAALARRALRVWERPPGDAPSGPESGQPTGHGVPHGLRNLGGSRNLTCRSRAPSSGIFRTVFWKCLIKNLPKNLRVTEIFISKNDRMDLFQREWHWFRPRPAVEVHSPEQCLKDYCPQCFYWFCKISPKP